MTVDFSQKKQKATELSDEDVRSVASCGHPIYGQNNLSDFTRRLGLDFLTRFIATQPVAIATAGIVAIAIGSAMTLSYGVWWVTAAFVPSQLMPITCLVTVIVATPISLYLVSIIKSVTQSSMALAALSDQLQVAHRQAAEASAAKSKFLASTSHELRTPLNAILGFSEVIKNQTFGLCGVARYVEYADDIHQSGKHLLRLINEVLDLSKIESGSGHIDLTASIDVSATISDCCRTLRVLAEKAEVHLIAEDAHGPIWIHGNDDLIRQILDNLLSNAIKFTPPGGKITISPAVNSSGELFIKVSDTGIGMTPEQLDVALDAFGQIDSKLSRKHHGTGLGLPLTKAMVELHGGKLTIESMAGISTVASFSIPAERVLGTMELAASAAR